MAQVKPLLRTRSCSCRRSLPSTLNQIRQSGWANVRHSFIVSRRQWRQLQYRFGPNLGEVAKWLFQNQIRANKYECRAVDIGLKNKRFCILVNWRRTKVCFWAGTCTFEPRFKTTACAQTYFVDLSLGLTGCVAGDHFSSDWFCNLNHLCHDLGPSGSVRWPSTSIFCGGCNIYRTWGLKWLCTGCPRVLDYANKRASINRRQWTVRNELEHLKKLSIRSIDKFTLKTLHESHSFVNIIVCKLCTGKSSWYWWCCRLAAWDVAFNLVIMIDSVQIIIMHSIKWQFAIDLY